jgi:hypothetical protein
MLLFFHVGSVLVQLLDICTNLKSKKFSPQPNSPWCNYPQNMINIGGYAIITFVSNHFSVFLVEVSREREALQLHHTKDILGAD